MPKAVGPVVPPALRLLILFLILYQDQGLLLTAHFLGSSGGSKREER